MITLPGFMVASCASEISRGAGLPGINAVVITISCLAIWFEDELGLRLLVFLGHLGRVAAGALALDSCDLLDEDCLGAEALDLFARRSADVGRRNLRAEPPGRRDRLETGDADAHHEYARRMDGPRRRHHHREGVAIFGTPHRAPPCSRRGWIARKGCPSTGRGVMRGIHSIAIASIPATA